MTDNPFDVDAATAANYAAARPYYHPLALALGCARIGVEHVPVGLDVGCGPGLSTRALAERADRVVAVDPAPAMLAARRPVPGALFVRARAERLPVRTGAVDVLTCAASMHWFTEAAFAELGRVTRPGGHVLVYSDLFEGELAGEPPFADWFRHAYLSRFPSPVRRPRYHDVAMRTAGFELVAVDEATHEVPMTRAGLAAYLMSQSNLTSAVAAGRVGETAVRSWLAAEFGRLVRAEPAAARFTHRVWVARRTG